MRKCLWDECSNQTSNPKFCSLSCGTKYQMRHNKPFEKTVVTKVCEECGKEISLTGKEKVKRFCNRSCSARHNNKLRGLKSGNVCKRCGARLSRKGKYCSRECSDIHRYDEFISAWLSGDIVIDSDDTINSRIRRFLLEEAGYKCQSPTCCVNGGWGEVNPRSGRAPLHIDHIDGNAKNNTRENLIVLCPNCHSLTPTFGGLNRGKGREWRRARYASVTQK